MNLKQDRFHFAGAINASYHDDSTYYASSTKLQQDSQHYILKIG